MFSQDYTNNLQRAREDKKVIYINHAGSVAEFMETDWNEKDGVYSKGKVFGTKTHQDGFTNLHFYSPILRDLRAVLKWNLRIPQKRGKQLEALTESQPAD